MLAPDIRDAGGHAGSGEVGDELCDGRGARRDGRGLARRAAGSGGQLVVSVPNDT